MIELNEEVKAIMDDVSKDIEIITQSWEKIQDRYSISAARQIRTSLDSLSHIKVDLRRGMLKLEKEKK